MPLAPLRTVERARPVVAGGVPIVLLQLALLFGGSSHLLAQTPVPQATKSEPAKVPSPATKPGWAELTAAQQAALHPLASAWSGISEVQKRKWIALAHNFPNLTAAERTVLHGRMTEWAALSPTQRSQARLNFAQTKGLSTEEKKAHWDAYQALSPEEKKRLAAGASQSKPSGAATAVTPIAPNKLAAVPVTRSESANPAAAASRQRASPSNTAAAKTAGAASAPLAKP